MTTASYQRIATEEAFTTPELLDRYRTMLRDGSYPDPSFHSLLGFYLNSTEGGVKPVMQKMADLDAVRLADMDATGIATQLLSLAAPGVQVFDAAEGTALARASNDVLADAIRRHPTRFSVLAAVAPQD